MKLQQLDIKGFKSFPDKTRILFDERITGIVGPNGCGKSNIIDSIRWVIGEQKMANLRSENLESLIFNGSKTRPSSGVAEVVLTFENTKNILPTEFHTLAITRKFYKNGESSYALNHTPCRLKDIQNLLMDTGICSGSYSIIELGMIDDLIKNKDGCRRKMIEQAAGISIYKTRKKEALSKLHATDIDLNRIADLLFEIDRQVADLHTQATQALKYKEIKENYRFYYTELSKAETEEIQQQITALNHQATQEENKLIATDTLLHQEEVRLTQMRQTLHEQEKSLQTLQKNFNDHLALLHEKETEKELALQEGKFLMEKKQSHHHHKTNIETSIRTQEENLSHLYEKQAKFQNILHQQEQNLNEWRTQHATHKEKVAEAKSALQEMHAHYNKEAAQVNTAEKTQLITRTNAQNLQEQYLHTQESIARCEQEKSALQAKQLSLQTELAAAKTALHHLIEAAGKQQEHITTLQLSLAQQKESLEAQNRQLHTHHTEYQFLKNLIDQMEGYPDGIKFLLQHPEWQISSPLLCDIIEVTPGYQNAIELALAPYLNYCIVPTLEAAKKGISLLAEANKGRAYFFILSEFANTLPQPPAIAHTSHALEVVSTDPVYLPLIQCLLHRVFIVEDISIPPHEDCILVHKEGDFLRTAHSLGGGDSNKQAIGRIGRKERLNALENTIAEQNQCIQQKQQLIAYTQNECNALRTALEKKEQERKSTEQALHLLERNLHSADHALIHLARSMEEARARLHTLQEQQNQLKERDQQMEHTLQAQKASLQALHEKVQIAQQNLNDLENTHHTYAQQLHQSELDYKEAQNTLRQITQDIAFQKKQLTQLQEEQQQLQKQRAQHELHIAENMEKSHALSHSIKELFMEKEQQEKNLLAAEEKVSSLKQNCYNIETHIKQQQHHKTQQTKKHQSTQEKINQLNTQLISIKERLSASFGISLEELMRSPSQTEHSKAFLFKEMKNYQEQLNDIGAVNTNAIESYEAAKERQLFISAQKEDLENAKNSLLKTIEEVEEAANTQFMKTFEQIKHHFRHVFKTLFSEEDECDLILANEQNLSDTDIEIMAQPKGKRPSNITQLSSGEKTLTSTALLFAMYLLKPAPFCILDEIDAPLDDINVEKFLKMVRQFSKQSQFIIVTHNKTTMASVDKIYGVTMAEAGVSKLVEVDFRTFEHT